MMRWGGEGGEGNLPLGPRPPQTWRPAWLEDELYLASKPVCCVRGCVACENAAWLDKSMHQRRSKLQPPLLQKQPQPPTSNSTVPLFKHSFRRR